MNGPATNTILHSQWTRMCLVAILFCSLGLSGCTSFFSPIQTIPADRLPPEFLARPRANDEPIDLALLGQEKPEHYILDSGDLLGILVEGALGSEDEPPPVQMPPQGSDLDPSIGYPTPVREDGTISIPLVDPIPVRGLSVPQAEELVKKTYVENDVLVDPRIIVTLMRKRTYRIFVVRQDNQFQSRRNLSNRRSQQAVTDRTDESGRAFVLHLPAYQNDLLNALSESGGLPGVNARSDVKILRASRNKMERRRRLASNFQMNNQNQGPPQAIPNSVDSNDANVVTVPLRLRPDQRPNFRAEDVILNDGDIVFVESRDSEVYYTGGLLGGGEWNLPRDYDLDVLGAAALAGNPIGVDRGGTGFGLQAASGSRVPPTQLIVLRQLPNNQQIAIEVDLSKAINDPESRLLVAPQDTLLLRYKPEEELFNFALGTFFTFGIRELFRN